MSLEVAVTISGPSVIAGTGLGWVEDGETLRPQDISYGPHGLQSTTSFPSSLSLPPSYSLSHKEYMKVQLRSVGDFI